MNIFITGGAGFIGSNAAKYFLEKGHKVAIFDNLSRNGSKANINWLKSLKNKPVVLIGDIRQTADIDKCKKYIKQSNAILHLAGQVAVTSSVTNPLDDFEINARGTLNVLECMRKTNSKAKCIYSSTNKVYGTLSGLEITEGKSRYSFKNMPEGISELHSLDFHSPYGCSKGSADQYIHDYYRIYNLDTVVFRQSCIYGPRQFGIEDQGWVAWFMIAVMLGKSITIYGDGKQVRDILFIDDLIRAYDLAIQKGTLTKGKIYNIGGGPKNTLSIWREFGPLLEKIISRKISVKFSRIRLGDQPVYVSDIRKAKIEIGWEPMTSVSSGLTNLYTWITSHKKLFH